MGYELQVKKTNGVVGNLVCKGQWRPAANGAKPHGGKPRCETLERRELLSASVVTGTQNYLAVSVNTTNGSCSGTSNGTAYQASANLVGTITYTSPTVGTVTGNLNGTITNPPNGEASPQSFPPPAAP